MRKTALALIAATAIAAICAAPAAQAFATRGSGPTESNKGTYRDGGAPGGAPSGINSGAPSTSVPEPGTLVLLAAGVTAIGGAALRRKRAARKGK